MPKAFGYPVNQDAWTPLSLRASYDALEGASISVIGRLAPGVSREQAEAELRVWGQRTAAALPATHEHLRPSVRRLGEVADALDIAQFAQRNLPVLLVLMIAGASVGTLVYARTATREGEIAVRSALGASRGRIIGQLFVESLVLASVAAALGLLAADRAVTWAVENFNQASGGTPFWFTPGLKLSTILYGCGLAVVSAAMLSFLPALKVTRAHVQTHLANRGVGGATLRFGRVWTGAMIVQVALTAIGIPVVLETAREAMRNVKIRSQFPSRDYVAARIDVDRGAGDETTAAFEARREQTFEELRRRIAEEPGVAAVTFADYAPGSGASARRGEVRLSSAAGPAFRNRFWTAMVDTGFFEAFDRPILSGRPFASSDRNPGARTVIVNEAFARAFSRDTGSGSPIGARLQYAAASATPDTSPEQPWFEIVGVVRDFGLDPDDLGNERAFVFHAAPAGALAHVVVSARVRGNPAALAARLPLLAAHVDGRLLVKDGNSLGEWVRQRDMGLIVTAAAQAAVTALVLFLSALSIFSLMSVSVSRRTREIGLRTALGANPRQVLVRILSRAIALMASGIAAGGALLLSIVAMNGPAEDIALYAGYFGLTSAIMLAACIVASIGPARRALRVNPADALREA
jgi:predicted permease